MKKALLLTTLFLSSLAPGFAQHQPGGGDHKHASPHGGIVKSAGNYHLELVRKSGVLTIYLLDGQEKPMAVTGATATALLQTQSGQVTTAQLVPVGNQQLTTTLDKTKVYHKAVITVAIGGQSASASFDLTAADSHAAHQH